MKAVLSFDLDFTIIDNKEGIINSFNHALQKHELSALPPSEIEKMIGTPLNDMFAKVSSLEPAILSTAFREYYGSKGIYQVRFIPGAKQKLKELKNDGFILGAITSKKEEMAVKLLKYLNIFEWFDYVLGETAERMSKTDPKLKEYLSRSFPSHSFIVIGDHPKDKALAEFLNCPFIGVLTGFHSKQDLMDNESPKTMVLNSIAEINEDLIKSLVE